MHPANFHRLTTITEAEELCLPQQGENSTSGLFPSIHFIWVGTEPPLGVMRRMHGWASLNSSFNVCLWGNDMLEVLAHAGSAEHLQELMDAAPNASALSDIGRFAILNAFGGIYLDADMEACRPITPLLEYGSGFVVRESKWLLTASALGLPPASMFGRTALRLMQKIRDRRGSIDNYITGPPLITELSRAGHFHGVNGPEVLPEWTFFPDNPFRFPRRTLSSMPPYGIHLFDHSWAVGTELKRSRRIARALLQLVSPRDAAVGKRREVQLELRQLAMGELANDRQ